MHVSGPHRPFHAGILSGSDAYAGCLCQASVASHYTPVHCFESDSSHCYAFIQKPGDHCPYDTVSTLEILGQDYIQTARAQGFSKRKVIFGCALKNAMNAIVTVAGLQFGLLIGGAVITEKVFGWPGLGI